MDIAAVSMEMNQSQLSQQVGISILKQAMDTASQDCQALTKMMEQSVNPNLGNNLDISV